MKDFKGKVALITGAGNGFGQEFSKEAARRGMKLFLADIDENDLHRTEKTVSALGAEVKGSVVDVSLEADVNRMVDECMAAYGKIDLLINNAGIVVPGRVDMVPTRDWEWIINTNCMSQIWAMKRVIPIMRGQKTRGYILNVASLAGLTSMSGITPYFSTKHFSVALSESVYYDLQEEKANIGMSVFCPGFIQTDLHHCERHRPERYKNPEDPYYTSEAFNYGQRMAEYEIMNGTALDEVGPYVFDKIEKDHFYIEIHPNTKIMIKHRNKDIVEERNPDFEYIQALNDLSHGKKSMKRILTVLRKQ